MVSDANSGICQCIISIAENWRITFLTRRLSPRGISDHSCILWIPKAERCGGRKPKCWPVADPLWQGKVWRHVYVMYDVRTLGLWHINICYLLVTNTHLFTKTSTSHPLVLQSSLLKHHAKPRPFCCSIDTFCFLLREGSGFVHSYVAEAWLCLRCTSFLLFRILRNVF